MKKILLSVVPAVAMLLTVAFAADYSGAQNDRIIVDRSTRSKVLNDYVRLARDSIQRAWKTPINASTSEAVKGRVRINFSIKRSGALESINLVEGSGDKGMDGSLLKAIRAAQPFPPFPDEVTAPKILIRANFIVADVPRGEVRNTSQPINRVNQVKTVELPKIVAPVAQSADKDLPKAVRPETKDDRTASKAPKLKWGRAAGAAQKSVDKGASVSAPAKQEGPRKKAVKFKWGR